MNNAALLEVHTWKQRRFPLSASVVSWSCGFTCLDKLTLPLCAHGIRWACVRVFSLMQSFCLFFFCHSLELQGHLDTCLSLHGVNNVYVNPFILLFWGNPTSVAWWKKTYPETVHVCHAYWAKVGCGRENVDTVWRIWSWTEPWRVEELFRPLQCGQYRPHLDAFENNKGPKLSLHRDDYGLPGFVFIDE